MDKDQRNHELQLQALRQVINSRRTAKTRVKDISFRYIGFMVLAAAALSSSVINPSHWDKIIITVGILLFCIIGIYSLSVAVKIDDQLFKAMLSLEERLGFYTPGAIGLEGTALPIEFNNPINYISKNSHRPQIAVMILLTIMTISTIWF